MKATGIATIARRLGRSPPVAHDSTASVIGKVLNTSSASATGMRATALAMHRLCTVSSAPTSAARASVRPGSASDSPAARTSASANSAFRPARASTAVGTLAPWSNATREAT